MGEPVSSGRPCPRARGPHRRPLHGTPYAMWFRTIHSDGSIQIVPRPWPSPRGTRRTCSVRWLELRCRDDRRVGGGLDFGAPRSSRSKHFISVLQSASNRDRCPRTNCPPGAARTGRIDPTCAQGPRATAGPRGMGDPRSIFSFACTCGPAEGDLSGQPRAAGWIPDRRRSMVSLSRRQRPRCADRVPTDRRVTSCLQLTPLRPRGAGRTFLSVR